MVRPRIKLFDVIGVLSVIAWFSVVGIYVYGEYFAPEPGSVPGGAVFQEGESYMLLTREDAEVGYIHEARTFVGETDSWLLEYDLVMNVSMLGIDQYLQTRIKASVNQKAQLESFSGTIETVGTQFEITGEVEGESTVVMKMDIAGEMREQRIELNERPRLANSALNELVGNKEQLEPGMTFEQEYFDPTKMGMTTMTFEYVRERKIDVYDEKVDTFHFRQKVGGTELDAYVDANGEVQLQEFPLRIVGARVPNVLGRARALSFNEKLEAEGRTGLAMAGKPSLGLEAALELVSSGTLGANVDASVYRISGIPDGTELELASLQQDVTRRFDGGVEIDTSKRGDVGLEAQPANLDALKAADAQVDSAEEVFAALLPEGTPKSATLTAEAIARSVREAIKDGPASGAATASAVLQAGAGDFREQSLALVAALRHHGVGARFVSGVRMDDAGNFVPHLWVQYWDGKKYFVDIDTTTSTMMPSNRQIQLFTHVSLDQPALAAFIGDTRIERIDANAPTQGGGEEPQGADSDFN